MLRELANYYAENGILSTDFTCKFRENCQGDCEAFTGPKSAFVSSGYADNELPRLLFLSLDSGSGDPVAENRLPAAVQKHEEWDRAIEFVLAGIGVVLGLGLAAGVTRLMSSILVGVNPVDPLTYSAVAGGLLVVALLASYLPARRASRVDPMTALRMD